MWASRLHGSAGRMPGCPTAEDGCATSERAAKVLEAIQTFFDYVEAGGVAEPDGAVVAEGGSRNYGDAGFTKQTVGEILRCQAELTNVNQHIKSALRFDRGHVRDLRDAIEHVIATHVEFLAHIGDRLLITS